MDNDLLRKNEDEEEEIYSDASTHTVVPDTFSDMDKKFYFKKIEQATLVKEMVVEKEIDDGKYEKKLPTDKGISEKKVPELWRKKVRKALRYQNQQPNRESCLHRLQKKKLRFIFMKASFLQIFVAQPC